MAQISVPSRTGFRAAAVTCSALSPSAHLALGLADVHVDELGALHRQEVEGALRGHRLRQQRLAGACEHATGNMVGRV